MPAAATRLWVRAVRAVCMVRVSQRRVRDAAGCRIYQDPSVTFPSGVIEVLNFSDCFWRWLC